VALLSCFALLLQFTVTIAAVACATAVFRCAVGAASAEDVAHFYTRSPQSVVNNVSTPSMFIVGDKDLRCPPHQSYYFMHSLKERGIDTRLYNYPGSGHGLVQQLEHSMDAYCNISMWFDRYLCLPYEPAEEEVK